MQTTSLSPWLMMASTATAVFPVCRSPMISSRWPRPMGTIASIALSPVCSGSFTGCRSTTPGASRSMGRNCLVPIGPLPSIGWPSALTTRPSISSPTGTEMMRLVRLTGPPSLMALNSPRSTAPTLSSSRFSAMPKTPCGNSSISPAMAFSTPCTRAMPSPIEMMLPTSATSTSTAKLPICSRMILDISSALMSISLALHESFSELLELPRDAAVVDHAADARDEAANDRRIDARLQRHRSTGDGGETLLDLLNSIGRERRGRRHFGTHDLAIVGETIAIRGDEIRDENQSIAVGKQPEQLRDDRRQLRARRQLDNDPVFSR